MNEHGLSNSFLGHDQSGQIDISDYGNNRQWSSNSQSSEYKISNFAYQCILVQESVADTIEVASYSNGRLYVESYNVATDVWTAEGNSLVTMDVGDDDISMFIGIVKDSIDPSVYYMYYIFGWPGWAADHPATSEVHRVLFHIDNVRMPTPVDDTIGTYTWDYVNYYNNGNPSYKLVDGVFLALWSREDSATQSYSEVIQISLNMNTDTLTMGLLYTTGPQVTGRTRLIQSDGLQYDMKVFSTGSTLVWTCVWIDAPVTPAPTTDAYVVVDGVETQFLNDGINSGPWLWNVDYDAQRTYNNYDWHRMISIAILGGYDPVRFYHARITPDGIDIWYDSIQYGHNGTPDYDIPPIPAVAYVHESSYSHCFIWRYSTECWRVDPDTGYDLDTAAVFDLADSGVSRIIKHFRYCDSLNGNAYFMCEMTNGTYKLLGVNMSDGTIDNAIPTDLMWIPRDGADYPYERFEMFGNFVFQYGLSTYGLYTSTLRYYYLGAWGSRRRLQIGEIN